MPKMDTVTFATELSLFEYDDLEQLPAEYRDLTEDERADRIAVAREALGDDVVVLGHNYQRRVIVEQADFIGDSYQLSKRAAEADAPCVVFCGVTFMAESMDVVLLDNLSPGETRDVIDLLPGGVLAEASGGSTLDDVPAYAATGVDVVSMGSLTHSAPVLDYSFRTG